MEKFTATYVPGPGEPKRVTAFGAIFAAGKATEVDPKYRAKLLGNPYFKVNSSLKDSEFDYATPPEPPPPPPPEDGVDDEEDETVTLSKPLRDESPRGGKK